jgi:hypothetical protein
MNQTEPGRSKARLYCCPTDGLVRRSRPIDSNDDESLAALILMCTVHRAPF